MRSEISYFHSGAKNQLERRLYSLLLDYTETANIMISRTKIKQAIDQFITCYLNKKKFNNFSSEGQMNELKSSFKLDRFLKIIFKLIEEIRRYETIDPMIEFDHPDSVYQYFYHLRTLDREMMKAVYLRRYQYLETRDLFLGGCNSILMTPKEVLTPAIKIDATQMILVHNHPNGQVTPSEEDFAFTRKIETLAKKFEIELMDHLVIGDGYFSFKKEGLL